MSRHFRREPSLPTGAHGVEEPVVRRQNLVPLAPDPSLSLCTDVAGAHRTASTHHAVGCTVADTTLSSGRMACDTRAELTELLRREFRSLRLTQPYQTHTSDDAVFCPDPLEGRPWFRRAVEVEHSSDPTRGQLSGGWSGAAGSACRSAAYVLRGRNRHFG